MPIRATRTAPQADWPKPSQSSGHQPVGAHVSIARKSSSRFTTVPFHASVMAQICLLNSSRLGELLKEALSWNESVSSLMVSATNGAILSYAFRDSTPTIKELRSLSTTATAAYTVASESTLVFEAQLTRAISVITPLAEFVLLAVTGPERKQSQSNSEAGQWSTVNGQTQDTNEGASGQARQHEEDRSQSREEQRMRADLEGVSEELAATLREELSTMKWPDDF